MLYHPPDLDAAHATWAATCGPMALAAVLGQPCLALHPLFPAFPGRDYVNPTQMQQALRASGVPWQRVPPPALPPHACGLAFIQFTGRWTQPGVPVVVAYRYTHWVGFAPDAEHGLLFFDCNGTQPDGTRGQWMPRPWWGLHLLPHLTAAMPGADGGYFVRWACTVAPQT